MPTRAPTELMEWPHGDTAARTLGASKKRRGPFTAGILAYLSLLYRIGVRVRNTAYDTGALRSARANLPVISVGNIVAGGAGKTPFARWLVNELVRKGRRVALLHGGYGSDEPELHRRWQPSAVVIDERDRVRAALYAHAKGADTVVLDDAFQHRRLARDLDIVLVPLETTDQRLLPRGPLREPMSALARAHVIVVTRKTGTPAEAAQLAAQLRHKYNKPVAVVALLPRLNAPITGPVGVVAAIARPDLFVKQLRDLRVEITRTLAYPDHYEYTPRDADHINRVLGDLLIVTTEKDAAKLSEVIPVARLRIVEQALKFEEGREQVVQAVERVL